MSSLKLTLAVLTAALAAACGDATRVPTIPLRADVATDPSSCSFATVGMTMNLVADCTTDATITIPAGLRLDGHGHTIKAVDPSRGALPRCRRQERRGLRKRR